MKKKDESQPHGGGGGRGLIGVEVRAPSGQAPDQLGNAPRFGARQGPVGGSGAEGDPIRPPCGGR